MNNSYACFVTYQANNQRLYPSWMVAERYDFCDSVTRFFSKIKR